jgi:hypothetical protein
MVAEVTFDVCRSCGGIWFDQHELHKVDEAHEEAGELLALAAEAERRPTVSADKRQCPRCDGIPMMRHFFSVKHEVEVDECPTCGGYWLDCGELRSLRGLFPSEEERKKAATTCFDAIADQHLGAMRAESEAKGAKARRIANLFRFICPSYYLAGNQKWGAF